MNDSMPDLISIRPFIVMPEFFSADLKCKFEEVLCISPWVFKKSSGLRPSPSRPAGTTATGESSPGKLPRSSIGTKQRSEEHTSELQSLMRISYAVFCLKKKINN